MNDIVINNSTNYSIDNICNSLIDGVLDSLDIKNASLSLNLVTNEEIRQLNAEYRNKDNVTDVITFSYEDEANFNELFEVRELGDIFIAVDVVVSNSKKYQHKVSREMAFVVAHGVLHTLGYDHNTDEEEKIMFSLQEKLIQSIIVKGSELDEIFN